MIVGFPVRAAVSLLVLAASVTGIARSVIDLVPATIDALVRAIGAG
jgi:flagellar biosynthesis protein FliR